MTYNATMFLSENEIRELTGKKRRDCQIKILNLWGIFFRKRPDGSLAISKEHVQKEFHGNDVPVITKVEPNWGALNA